MDRRFGFEGIENLYEDGRPGYPDEVGAYLQNVMNIPEGTVFADIGSGTGKFTQILLDSGYRVYAVEPDIEMRNISHRKLEEYDGYLSIAGTGEDTTLDDDSCEYVTCAQAFHWMNRETFREEMKRILIPEGKLIIVYNMEKEDDPVTSSLLEIKKHFIPGFQGFHHGLKKEEIYEFFGGECQEITFENSQIYRLEEFIDRVLSSSQTVEEGTQKFFDYYYRLLNLFEMHEKTGFINYGVETKLFIGQL